MTSHTSDSERDCPGLSQQGLRLLSYRQPKFASVNRKLCVLCFPAFKWVMTVHEAGPPPSRVRVKVRLSRLSVTVNVARKVKLRKLSSTWDAWKTIRTILSKASYGPHGGPYCQKPHTVLTVDHTVRSWKKNGLLHTIIHTVELEGLILSIQWSIWSPPKMYETSQSSTAKL